MIVASRSSTSNVFLRAVKWAYNFQAAWSTGYIAGKLKN